MTQDRDGCDQIEETTDRWQELVCDLTMKDQTQDGRRDGNEKTDGGNDSNQMGRSRDSQDDGDGRDLHDEND